MDPLWKVSKALSTGLLDHLYRLMRQLMIKDYDKAYLALLAHITAHGIHLAQAPIPSPIPLTPQWATTKGL